MRKKKLFYLLLIVLLFTPIMLTGFTTLIFILPFRLRFLIGILVATFLGFCFAISMILKPELTQRFGVETLGFGVYWDKNCTKKVTNIKWGTLSPGTVKNRYFYIRNEGLLDKTIHFRTKDWSPKNAPEYIFLALNCNGKKLSPNQTVKAKLTLKVSKKIKKIVDFNFSIVIEG